ncbi:hypothetical protein HO133_001048 [Letharia lupina]|uniref:Uncharacterized protein n=1 Tax=Letharia lupina TaxID=560253 RepID=A0A8H6FC49_9LECA|nr:uncharacterized protein HO133_001048 [Letharia lupina]KAF6222997.1 hypothetical protein HO133_001048 [Letharia lupina]
MPGGVCASQPLPPLFRPIWGPGGPEAPPRATLVIGVVGYLRFLGARIDGVKGGMEKVKRDVQDVKLDTKETKLDIKALLGRQHHLEL